jgi:hypothetical protein
MDITPMEQLNYNMKLENATITNQAEPQNYRNRYTIKTSLGDKYLEIILRHMKNDTIHRTTTINGEKIISQNTKLEKEERLTRKDAQQITNRYLVETAQQEIHSI